MKRFRFASSAIAWVKNNASADCSIIIGQMVICWDGGHFRYCIHRFPENFHLNIETREEAEEIIKCQ